PALESLIDDVRRETVLTRKTPERWIRLLTQAGVVRQLWATDDVIRVDRDLLGLDPDEDFLPRLGVAIRAGDEMLGSIWVVRADKPFTAAAEEALREAGRIAAL